MTMESILGVLLSFFQGFASTLKQLGEDPEETIRYLQTADGKILLPGMAEFVVTARRGKKLGKALAVQLAEWKIFYKKFFRHNLDVDNIQIHARPDGFDRLIVVAKGFTLNQIYTVMARHFDCCVTGKKKIWMHWFPKMIAMPTKPAIMPFGCVIGKKPMKKTKTSRPGSFGMGRSWALRLPRGCFTN